MATVIEVSCKSCHNTFDSGMSFDKSSFESLKQAGGGVANVQSCPICKETNTYTIDDFKLVEVFD